MSEELMEHVCECGCGVSTKVDHKGRPYRFKPGHCFRAREPRGRRWIGTKREYVVIAERAIGKPLPKGAEVHHVDGDDHNNDPANLVVCQDRAYHFLLERRQRALQACGHADWRICNYC